MTRSYNPLNSKIAQCFGLNGNFKQPIEVEVEIGEERFSACPASCFVVLATCQYQDAHRHLCYKGGKCNGLCYFSTKNALELKAEFFPAQNVFGLKPIGI